MSETVALIDADSIVYILAWKFKDQSPYDTNDYMQVQGQVDQFIIGILQAVDAESYVGALGHKQPCFRYNIAKYKPYKGTRKEKDPWVVAWEPVIRNRLFNTWGFISIAGFEADDIVSLGTHIWPNYVICSPDKDLKQLPGTHFDYKKGQIVDISVRQADYLFWYQMLVGDVTDNVAGLPGYGPKKAEEKLLKAHPEEFLSHIVRNEYVKYFGNYYGDIIFRENIEVLQLVYPLHSMYDTSLTEEVKNALRHYKIQQSVNDIFPET